MGKRSKHGAALRARKRANAAHQQLAHDVAEHGEQYRAQSKRDDELFVLDTARKETVASNRARREAKAKDLSRKRKYEHSARETRAIRRVLRIHGKEGAIALAARGKALDEQRTRKQRTSAACKPTFDLWDAPPPKIARGRCDRERNSNPHGTPPALAPAGLSRKQIKARKRAQADAPPQLAVEVAHPGQSYRPDGEQHQDAIGAALAIEIRRNEAAEYKAAPVSEGMSASTRNILVASDSEEDSSDDDDEGGCDATSTATLLKRKEKLTRAQRNKQKRVKAEETSLKGRRRRKQFLHEANEVHVKKKALERAEREQRQRQADVAALKSETKARPLGKDVWSTISEKDPVGAPSFPVALTEELLSAKDGGTGGGLRTVVPKGSLVTDRLESMATRNMIAKKRTEGRRVVQGKSRPKARGAQGTEYLLI